ncbi:sterol-sensing domain of SREBP cleavage-activation-domain-containing protein [Massariosphaeria phaeospora]|uniref:Sterol regulatory element-binding protein cleavage-activating protein n=1 Tax=Massariosphaeria phaeospora TaxID=100035 RepID=A0A7C8MDI6_9PLEO|nr:sterol-sensing domain of SREBP cleavage-activation-domain-containing protein [Massariosphaeria phaeospora]
MIWYLLYPLRRTTEPLRLSPAHPLRQAFQAHGTATARHWLLSILSTIAISVLLCYPAVFHTDSPAAIGLRNLPKHVWTSTTEVHGEHTADVELRQVWVYGDYMKAIEPHVLREALHVQNALIGQGFDAEDEAVVAPNASAHDSGGYALARAVPTWGFHSPLMYWNSSYDALERDTDLPATINARSAEQTALNLTLRPSTVFAGKAFSGTKLRAADNLVITLFDRTNSTIGQVWESRSKAFAQELSPEWDVFPEDGYIAHSLLYEFRLQPMTVQDNLFLAASYLGTAAFVIYRLMQLRAVRSWFGLLITICVKMTVCLISSFTICTFLGINLASIPRPWYPLVVVVFGLGNIFRLINEVLQTPPEMPPHQRIGNALGEVGHLSLTVAGENLVLIYLVSLLSEPWVADFCVFAVVTLVLDLVFHFTFFLAVLSVDVQRMELSDSLERTDLCQASKIGRQERQSWLHALRQGNLPLSTRFAGSAAIFSILLALNWHFFDIHAWQFSLGAMRDQLRSTPTQQAHSEASAWSPPPIYQARSPAEWLRMQDHNTARELFDFIKPESPSFIARVFDPLYVVSRGAHGRYVTPRPSSLQETVRLFARNHAFPAALIVVFLIAGVTLLMNYLLWTGLPETTTEHVDDEEATFSVKTLPTSQSLDIFRLASCPKGHLLSISLDRSTSIWIHRRGRGHTHTPLLTTTVQPKLWPIVACSMDDSGTLLALCTDTGQIGIWGLATSRFIKFETIELRGQVPNLFSFASKFGTEQDKLSLIVTTPDGYLTELKVQSGDRVSRRISSVPIVHVVIYTSIKGDTSLVFVSKTGKVHIISLKEDCDWSSEVVAGLDPPPQGNNLSKITCVESVPSLGLIFALRPEEADIFDFHSRALIHSFKIGSVKPHTFRVMHSTRRACTCGAPSVHTFCVAYTELDTDLMVMQTFTLDDTSSSQICLGKPTDNESLKCQGLGRATEAVHSVDPAGVWESTSILSVVGIRKCVQSPTPSSTTSGVDGNYFPAKTSTLASALKQRPPKKAKPSSLLTTLDAALHSTRRAPASPSDSDSWEAWTLSSAGEFRARPLVDAAEDAEDAEVPLIDDQLFVAAPGPIAKLGQRSVAVGFGNTLKIVTLGKESFDGAAAAGEGGVLDMRVGSYGGRRGGRGVGRKVQ